MNPSQQTPSSPEYQYDAAFFLITAETNLQAGAGGENYWIIDNLIQRDPATNLPCIHGSSLKGALREFLTHCLKSEKDDHWIEFVIHAFGQERSEKDENNEEYMKRVARELSESTGKQVDWRKVNVPASYRVLSAQLLSIPIRSNNQLFYNVTSPWLVGNFIEQMALFGKRHTTLTGYLKGLSTFSNFDGNSSAHHAGQQKKSFLEEEKFLSTHHDQIAGEAAQSGLISSLFGGSIAVAKDNVLAELTDDYHLPVIARNHLEDGRSTNLWYEQVLPAQTRLIFPVLYPKGDKYFTRFSEVLTKCPVQIGANASVGYGFCTLSSIPVENLASS